MADLVPGLQRCARLKHHLLQLALIIAGTLIISFVQFGERAH